MTTTDHPGVPPGSVPPVTPASGEAGIGAEDDEETRLGLRLDPRHFGIDPDEPWPEDVPRAQDDTHWRYEDDPKGARRAELRIAACWTVTVLSAFGLAAAYIEDAPAPVQGAFWAAAFLGLGIGFILWARDLLPGHDVTASRGHHNVSAEPDRRAVTESFTRGMEPMARRPFLFKMLGAVSAVFGLAILFPFASLGPRPGVDLYQTKWRKGSRATTVDGVPVRPGDIAVNGILTVFPDGDTSDALSPTLLMNLGDAPFEVPPSRNGWNVGGLVAFSKICTHAGCPVALYNVSSHQLVCPCHQSTFDVLKDCKPVFGPAPRSLPQLPITVDSDGFVVSQSDYTEPVGPGFWNRG
jgi:quinol---cytochrome c reductase iron-sulfur subunit